MASANRNAYILKTVQDALATETTFDVRKVWVNHTVPSGKAIVYPFIASTTFDAVMENGVVEEGRASVIIWSDLKAEAEGTTPTGKSFIQYADCIAKIETCIAALTLPRGEAHTGNVWRTDIVNVVVNGAGGHVANNDTTINADVQITVYFRHTKL